MAFWIVFQGSSWKRAKQGGHLWAPHSNEAGQTLHYWRNMARVEPGDLIFAGVDKAIRALAQAPSKAYDADSPYPEKENHWATKGWRIDVAFVDLPEPLYYADWVPEIVAELPSLYSPFDRTHGANQGYLFEIPLSVGQFLVERIGRDGIDIAARATEPPLPPGGDKTEAEQRIKARVGQGKFRSELIRLWKGACAVSGANRENLLRASHIKPWSASNNKERLDPSNGLLLAPSYDAAFDATLISFADDGSMILASDFPVAQAQMFGIDPQLKLPRLPERTREYLAVHRQLMAARERRQKAVHGAG